MNKTILHGFRLETVDQLDEFRCRGSLYIHEKTGTPVYHLAAADRENLVAFVFRTPPENSTGVAHILEHSVLCGSKRYPTKDPFLYLYKSSLNTFLNAMTYPDKTVYPTSSIVAKDFYNLVKVYGDAVFFPLLKPEVFAQEGHRLELEESGGLIRSGVVYNEMKGNYSSPESVIGDAVMRSLFDQGPYSHDSGGDPKHIPQLTYEAFVAFHKQHYHPSQSLIFLYGDLPPGPSLKLLDQRFLRHFERKEPAPEIRPQPRWNKPTTVRTSFPVSNEEEGAEGTVALTWLVADALDHENVLALDILTEVLLGDAGLLHKVLLESGLGQDLSPISGLETELRDVAFTVGLRGADEEKSAAFEKLVLSELDSIAKRGIPQDLLDSVIASYEFGVREIKGAGMGLRFLRRLTRSWLHGGRPGESLAFEPWMSAFKQKLQNGESVLENLISQRLVQNSHRALVVCTPDPERQKKEEDQLRDEMSALRMKMDASELETLKRAQERLTAFQETPDFPKDVAKLPQLRLSDIPPQVEKIASVWETVEGVPLAIHEAFANGVAYVDLAFDLHSFSEDDWLHLPLLQRVLDSLGLKGLSYDLLAREIALKSGGIQFRVTADSPLSGADVPVCRFWVRIKMLEERIPSALDLLEKVLTGTDWKNETRMRDLLFEMKNDFQGALVPRGHLFAASKSAESFAYSSLISELTSGLSQLDFLAKLTDPTAKKDVLPELLKKLSSLAVRIFHPSSAMGALTGERSAVNQLKTGLGTLFKSLAGAGARSQTPGGSSWSLTLPKPTAAKTIRIIPSTVGFTALTIRSTHLQDELHAAELVLSHRLKTGFLWEEIRMKGGAYGAFSFNNGLEGLFTFATYRDPGLVSSLKAFRSGLQDAQKNLLPRRELENTIIGTVSNDLTPRSPAEEGYLFLQRHLLGLTDEMRQKKRDAMRKLRAKDLADAARNLEKAFDDGISFTLTGKSIAEEAMKNSDWEFKVLES